MTYLSQRMREIREEEDRRRGIPVYVDGMKAGFARNLRLYARDLHTPIYVDYLNRGA